MSKMIVAISGVGGGLLLANLLAPSDVEFNLSTVDDSTSYYLYHYELVNPTSSTGGLVSVSMDVTASSGTPQPLASTGTFRNWTGSSPTPFAEVGTDVPNGWRGTLTHDGLLSWHLPTQVDSSPDSVSPGDTVLFAIRSSYLPGLRNMSYAPTVESCCLEPVDTTEERWLGSPLDFEVPGIAVGPRYMPEEIDLNLLQGQLATVCDDPLWIDDPSLCSELSDSLDAAEARLAINNVLGGRQAIAGARWLVENNVEPGGDVNMNAHELLRLNSTQLLTNIGWPTSNPQSQLCVWSDSEATAYFTIVASGDSLKVASPYAAEGEIEGVDPPNSSCELVWTMPYAGIDTVDVSIRLDSVSAGSELSMIHSSGGLGMGDTISVWIGPDSLEFRHDGVEASTVVVVLVDSSQQN